MTFFSFPCPVFSMPCSITREQSFALMLQAVGFLNIFLEKQAHAHVNCPISCIHERKVRNANGP